MGIEREDIERIAKATGEEISRRIGSGYGASMGDPKDALRKDIEDQIRDEELAYEKYNRMAKMAQSRSRYDIATELRGIALDEYRHKGELEGMLRRR